MPVWLLLPLFSLRRWLYRHDYENALRDYWSAGTREAERDAHLRLCWFGNTGGYRDPIVWWGRR